MAIIQFIGYTRVSTQQQGRSGLGLKAQQDAVRSYVATRGELIAEYQEIETGKGSDALDRRPELKAALARCKATGAVLVIAKLDRLARNVHFVSGLMESKVDFVATDMPHADKVMIQVFAVMSEWERDQIGKRTREALAAAKAKGVKLGQAGPANLRSNTEKRIHEADAFADRLVTVLAGFRGAGLSQREQVQQLNTLNVKTARGGQWSLVQLQRVLARNQPRPVPTGSH